MKTSMLRFLSGIRGLLPHLNTVYIFLFCFFLIVNSLSAQQLFMITSADISFFAGTPIEDIEATNKKVVGFFNLKTGEVMLSMQMKDFHFKRALMEEHFNENYLESDKYPRSEFKGKIIPIVSVDFLKPGEYKVILNGILQVHGIAKTRKIEALIKSDGTRLVVESKFEIPLADHQIDRPKLLWEKLADTVDVKANLIYEVYKK